MSSSSSSSPLKQRRPKNGASFDDAAVTTPGTLAQSSDGRLQRTMESVAFIVLAVVVVGWSGMVEVLIRGDPRILWEAMVLGWLMSAGFVTAFLYLILYLPLIAHVQVDFHHWQRDAPRAIPIATGFGVLAFVAYTVALWPIYHLATVPLLFCVLLGTVSLLSFLG